MIASKSSRFRLQVQKRVFTILLFSIVGLLAWLSLQNSVQYDWSANQRNSVSQQSIDVLRTMAGDITVSVYVQDNEMTREAITEILQRYQREKNDFTFKLINPDLDIAQAQDDGIKQFGQIVIRYNNKKEIISSLSERTISSALLRLSRNETRNIVFLTGHDERNPSEGNNHGYSKLNKQLQSDGFKIKQIHLLKNQIPADTSTLIIAGVANTLLAGEVKTIQEYITNGGNLLWLADPGELYGLDALADNFGLHFNHGIVVDNNIDLRKTLQIEHPAIIPVLEYYEHKITQGIKYNTLFPTSRGINVKPPIYEDSPWISTVLFSSFEQSWTETNWTKSNGLGTTIVFNSNDGDIAGPITLAIALEKERSVDDNTANASQRIVVVGDSDFLANSYIGAGANMALGLNMLNWLSGDNALLSIPPNGAPDTRLLLNDFEMALIGMGFLIAIPLFLLITGLAIWLKRRSA